MNKQNLFNIGENSSIHIESTSEQFMHKIHITCGKNSIIKILGIKVLNSTLRIHLGDDAELIIGPEQLMNGNVYIAAHEPSKILIGANCLWSNVSMWSSDMHKIISLDTNTRINHGQNITIGNYVWFGDQSLILKGAQIHDGCIVGARSVVTKSTPCESNSIIAGNPAKILRRNIKWQL